MLVLASAWPWGWHDPELFYLTWAVFIPWLLILSIAVALLFLSRRVPPS